MGRFEAPDRRRSWRVGMLAALCIAALAAPAADARAGAEKRRGEHRGQAVLVFEGTYAGGKRVRVRGGDRRVRRAKLVGRTVRFDFGRARFSVDDLNEDGRSGLGDVEVGDRVVVKACLPRAGSKRFRARLLLVEPLPGEDDGDDGEDPDSLDEDETGDEGYDEGFEDEIDEGSEDESPGEYGLEDEVFEDDGFNEGFGDEGGADADTEADPEPDPEPGFPW